MTSYKRQNEKLGEDMALRHSDQHVSETLGAKHHRTLVSSLLATSSTDPLVVQRVKACAKSMIHYIWNWETTVLIGDKNAACQYNACVLHWVAVALTLMGKLSSDPSDNDAVKRDLVNALKEVIGSEEEVRSKNPNAVEEMVAKQSSDLAKWLITVR